MVTRQPIQPINVQQLDLFSAAPLRPAAPAASAPRRVARLERTLRAGAWMSIGVVRGALAKPGSTMVQLVIDGMMEEDSGADLVYDFGARELRRLFEDEPTTSQIRITDDPGDARAISVEIRSGERAPHSRMTIRDGAWHTAPTVKAPGRRQRWRMGDAAYTAAYDTAIADRQKTIAARTVRVILMQP